MRIVIPIAITLLSIQCFAEAYKRNHEHKRKDKNLQTVKNQEHGDVSLLYGAMKDFEDSSQATEHHSESKQTQVIPNTEASRNTTKHQSERRMPFPKVYNKENAQSDHGMVKELNISHNTVIQRHDSEERAPIANEHRLSTIKSTKRKDLSIKSRDDEISPSIKKHKIPSRNFHHRHTRTRKRTKVEEALNKERQNIDKTIDSLDDLPGSFSKAVDMDGMDINEVSMIDNSTLSDYFHALNDNSSENNIDNNNNNNNNGDDVSPYTPTSSSLTTKSTWDESSPSYIEESNSGNDDFYDAIDNGDEPPPIKMKKVRPTKSHFHKSMSKSSTVSSSMWQNQGSETQHHLFRKPSQEDFENFFRGMLDHFGHGRTPDQAIKQSKTFEVNHQETRDNKNNITAFSGGHDRLPHGNVKKLVSLGSPERVDVTEQIPQHNMGSFADTNPSFFKVKEVGRDGEADTHNSWTERPFGNNVNPPSTQLLSQERSTNNFGHPPFTARVPLAQQVTQVNLTVARPQDAISSPTPFKGTRIMGGKISGGQISGGLIQGGQIKAGLIEGGVIKGGQVVGGHITNGTMEGGMIINGKMLGGHFMNGRLEGGQLIGGNVFGGKILGGSVEGGDLKGGVVAGGRFRGGSMQGGLLKGGEIQGGTVKGGKVEGGILHSGNIEGGEFKFGDISGGTLKSGAMLGGMLKNGSIEGGTLKGGIIEGGVLKGGVMEGGKLKGGLVLAGKIKGGIIEGGVIEGGEIGDGVLITGGKVNATIIGTGSSMDKNRRLGGLFKQGVNPQELGLKVDQQKYHHGSHNIQHASKVMSDPLPSPQAPIRTPQFNSGLKVMNPNSSVKIPLSEGVLKMLPKERDSSDDDDLEKLLTDGESENKKTPEPELSSQRFFEEQEQPSRVIQKKGNKHHVVFDGVGFDLPNEDFVDLIDKIRDEDLINYYYKNQDKEKHLKFGQRSKPIESVISSSKKIEHIKPEDLEMRLSSPTKPRSSVTHWNRDKSYPGDMEEVPVSKPTGVKFGKMRAVTLNQKDTERLRPTYHWSLNKLIKDRIPGSPGPAIRTHGKLKAIRGGLQLNGHDAWLGAGDFSGGCISDPDTCEDGLSFEMTFRLDKDALKYNDMNYIVDSGASTFNSKGFSLYTVHGNLRADLAIANQEFCLQIPLTVRKWQDILVTWKKTEGMKMYINCELKAHTKGSEHCIGCHSKGCHMTDTNTLLMIGRPNYSPHFHCTKFDSGDISFWEKYLSTKDVETLCGAPTGELEKNSASMLHPTPAVFPQVSQLKFAQPNVNQAALQVNPLQSYLANQRYFNRFTGLTARANDISHQLFTPWSEWSACSKTCGAGFRARRRSCINPKLFPSLCHGLSIQHQSCFDRLCPAYTPMLPGSALSGQQTESRLFTYTQPSLYSGGFHYPRVPNVNSGTENALARAMTIDGGYSEWSDWGACDRSCGGGAQVRTRICNKPLPRGGGKMCHSLGPAIQVRRCNRKGCPVDGGYSPWSEFGPCSKTCGTEGFQRRFRTCTNPAPVSDGKPCLGHPYQTRVCSTIACPVDGGYSMWSPWLPCDADCGGGVQERSRFCNNPAPQPGARDCTVLGSDKETRLCNIFPCSANF